MTQTSCGYQNRGQIEQTCEDYQWVDSECTDVWYASCAEILDDDSSASDGIYTIDPDGPGGGASPFDVYCDMSTGSGGWTRVNLYTRRWGNSQGFGSDPNNTSYGERYRGPATSAPLDDLTNCSGDTEVPIRWFGNGGELSSDQIAALNAEVSTGRTDASYYSYDGDGAADWDQLKGCFDGDVVMYGDGDEDAGADKVWSGPYALDSLDGLFTTGYYVGYSDSNGWNLSLPRYWFFR
jgi:hypothetical protein